jgi:hypothetical protein
VVSGNLEFPHADDEIIFEYLRQSCEARVSGSPTWPQISQSTPQFVPSFLSRPFVILARISRANLELATWHLLTQSLAI